MPFEDRVPQRQQGLRICFIEYRHRNDLQKKILFRCLSDEIARVHILSEKNVIHAIRSFEAVLKQLNGLIDNHHSDSSAAQ